MENAEAFIAAGNVRAVWDFIVFKHNEHQVEKAQSLSQKMGFYQFRLKKSHRFHGKDKDGKRGKAVLDKNGHIEYYLETPDNPDHINPLANKVEQLERTFGSMEKYWDQAIINCKAQQESKIYVSAEALVFPCCWTSQIYNWELPPETGEIWQLIKKLPNRLDDLNAIKHPINKIIANEFFKAIVDSWRKASVKKGKLQVCSRICGDQIDPFKSQFSG
jgi:hypothetical protein